jgi:outer membrane protein OmpA-like peptidoglycan-associated protein
VDKNGCPIDTDGDGVPDYLDKCPKTPKEAYNSVDQKGCPKDSDGDGVPDYLDKCPDTPKDAIGFVDKNGCPLDTDKDGVPDFLDKCPKTPFNVKVDSIGCPIDTDGDSVPDYLDKCPTIKGLASNNGCPETKVEAKPEVKPEIKAVQKYVVQTELKSLFQKALQGIQFESGNDLILNRSHKILNQIAGVLVANPGYFIEIRGFTDNLGNPEKNQMLSFKRANSVKKYLIGKGLDARRITTNGYGDKMPVATNKTESGRSQNRRVEFIVSFVEITFQ